MVEMIKKVVTVARVSDGNIPPPVPENPVGRKIVSAVKHNKAKSD
jgi:hypothetical protein